jgi:hypothetical protein
MITSIFKQIWNQRRKNAFIAVEMFFLFALIFAGGFHLADKLTTYFIPENYESQNRISLVIWSGNDNSEHQKEDMDRLIKNLSAIDDVILAGKAVDGPFGGSYSNSSIYVDSLQIGAEFRGGDPNLAEVLGFDVIEGQWFDQASLNLYASLYPFEKNMSKEQAAESTAHAPIVVDRLLAEKISETGQCLRQKILIDNRSCEVIGLLNQSKEKDSESRNLQFIFLQTGEHNQARLNFLFFSITMPTYPYSWNRSTTASLQYLTRKSGK